MRTTGSFGHTQKEEEGYMHVDAAADAPARCLIACR
jgi:hypothetical protein